MAKKTTYLPRGQRFLNTIFISLVRLGVVPGAHLISVPGRKSGIMRTTPVYVLNYQGQRWLVAGFEQADWVKNLRAAGWCLLIHNHREERVEAVEVDDSMSRTAILKVYMLRAPGGSRGFVVKPDASLDEFAAIAPHHPVFRIED